MLGSIREVRFEDALSPGGFEYSTINVFFLE